jgi:sugar lactone lactonase YvrE
VVVNPEKKLLRSIDVPSPAAPNLIFGANEEVLYIMAVDDVNNAPYPGKVYKTSNK